MTVFIVMMPIIVAIIALGFVLYRGIKEPQFISSIVGGVLVVGYAISGIGYLIGTAHSRFNEVWNQRGMSMKYEERWTTHETRTETHTTGSGKNQSSHTHTIHYTQTHGPYWTLNTEDGDKHSIDQYTYDLQKMIWKNEKNIGTHRGSSAGFDRSITGQIYQINWDNRFESIYPHSDIHTYVNKVRASKNSVMKYKKSNEVLDRMYPRPADNNNISPIIYYGNKSIISDSDVQYVRKVNASLGINHQIHGMFVVFDDKDMGVIDDVLSAWQGTNKNELVTFVGYDSIEKKISWVKCESWMDNTTMYGYMVDGLLGKELSGKLMGDTLMKNIKYWHRKSFKEFDYLSVEISMGGIIFSVIGWILTLVAMVIVVLKNENDFMSSCRSYGRYNRRW